MTRIYEELFIVKPDAPEEEVDQFVETLRTQLTTAPVRSLQCGRARA